MSGSLHRKNERKKTPRRRSESQFSLRTLMLSVFVACVVWGIGVQWSVWLGYVLGVIAVSAAFFTVWKPKERAFLSFLVLIAIATITAILLLPPINVAVMPARREACMSNLRQLAVALANYESAYGSMPPAYTTDAEGNKLHSWRTLVLPFLGQEKFYDQLRLDLPWDDTENALLTALPQMQFQCPYQPHYGGSNFTSYVAVLGPETMWPEGGARRLQEATDAAASTIMLVELARSDIAWAEPRDITLEELLASLRRGDIEGLASVHPSGVAGVAFADCHIQFLDPATVDEATLRAFFTVAGEETVEPHDLCGK